MEVGGEGGHLIQGRLGVQVGGQGQVGGQFPGMEKWRDGERVGWWNDTG